MNILSTERNDNLLMCHIGLTASGYDLADRGDQEIQGLIAAIHAAEFPDDITGYFSLARTNQYAVNPYWPRGSCLSAASLFINDDFSFSFEDYIEFERSVGASEAHQDSEFLAWIPKLPIFLRRLQAHRAFRRIRDGYHSIIDSRMEGYRAACGKIERCLHDFGCSSDERHIVFLPNLLQAHSMADFVTQGNTTYVIATHPDTTTILHEYLHPVVGQCRDLLAAYAASPSFSRLVNGEKMMSYGYMWDTSPAARGRALEECAVRGVAAVLASWAQEIDLGEYCRWNAESGFLLVPGIIAHAKQQKPLASNLQAYLRAAIDGYLAGSTD